MSKVQNETSRIVTAKDELYKELLKHISVSKEICNYYKNVCKRRSLSKPKHKVVKTHVAYSEIMQQGDKDIVNLDLFTHLIAEKHQLKDQLLNFSPPLMQ